MSHATIAHRFLAKEGQKDPTRKVPTTELFGFMREKVGDKFDPTSLARCIKKLEAKGVSVNDGLISPVVTTKYVREKNVEVKEVPQTVQAMQSKLQELYLKNAKNFSICEEQSKYYPKGSKEFVWLNERANFYSNNCEVNIVECGMWEAWGKPANQQRNIQRQYVQKAYKDLFVNKRIVRIHEQFMQQWGFSPADIENAKKALTSTKRKNAITPEKYQQAEARIRELERQLEAARSEESDESIGSPDTDAAPAAPPTRKGNKRKK